MRRKRVQLKTTKIHEFKKCKGPKWSKKKRRKKKLPSEKEKTKRRKAIKGRGYVCT